MNIKKNKFYLCTKEVVMQNGVVAYTEDKYYKSEADGCITDNQGHSHHGITEDYAEGRFREASADEVARRKAIDLIEPLLKYDSDGHRELDRLNDYQLMNVIVDTYNSLSDTYDDGKKRAFTTFSESYDWWTNLKVLARNSHNGIFENVSWVGKVHIVLFNQDSSDFDEFDVEKEMREMDWSNKVEEYTLYDSEVRLVGFVYSDKE